VLALIINQSYFLCQLSQEQLSKSLFIGELTKPEVREIAAQMELVTAEKRILKGCVLGKVRLPEFYNKTTAKEGSIIQIDKNDGIYAIQEQEGCLRGGIISFE
jgi:tRNA-specific 2-thiouridylase